MFFFDLWSAEGDDEDQDTCAAEQNDGKMEVVDATEDKGARGWEDAAARAIDKLGYHATETHGQTSDQTPEGTLQSKITTSSKYAHL